MGWGTRRQLSEKALKRGGTIEQFIQGSLSRIEAASILGKSTRQVTRMAERFRRTGVEGLEHAKFGTRAPNQTEPETYDRIRELATGKYVNFNCKHLHEMLADHEKIEVSYSTVKRITKSAGLRKLVRRTRRKRKYRDRYPTEGLMLQMDGSEHDWVAGKNWCLISGIDDATSEVPYAEFFETEGLDGYLKVLTEVFRRWGIPRILYVDHASWLSGTTKSEGKGQFKRICDELGINLLFANSPQAKGRIERLWGTFQDRLVAELGLHKIQTKEAATAYLNDVFLPNTWRKKFMIAPRAPESSLRPPLTASAIREILCYKYRRVVRNDETILWANEMYQITSDFSHSLSRREVEIRIYDDGDMGAFYGGRRLELSPICRPGGRAKKTIPDGIPMGLRTKIKASKNGINILHSTG
jgi:transposase